MALSMSSPYPIPTDTSLLLTSESENERRFDVNIFSFGILTTVPSNCWILDENVLISINLPRILASTTSTFSPCLTGFSININAPEIIFDTTDWAANPITIPKNPAPTTNPPMSIPWLAVAASRNTIIIP